MFIIIIILRVTAREGPAELLTQFAPFLSVLHHSSPTADIFILFIILSTVIICRCPTYSLQFLSRSAFQVPYSVFAVHYFFHPSSVQLSHIFFPPTFAPRFLLMLKSTFQPSGWRRLIFILLRLDLHYILILYSVKIYMACCGTMNVV